MQTFQPRFAFHETLISIHSLSNRFTLGDKRRKWGSSWNYRFQILLFRRYELCLLSLRYSLFVVLFQQGHMFFLVSINLLPCPKRTSVLMHSPPDLHSQLWTQNCWSLVSFQMISDLSGYHLEASKLQNQMNLLRIQALYLHFRMKTFSYVFFYW